jgi:hypothetical protein
VVAGADDGGGVHVSMGLTLSSRVNYGVSFRSNELYFFILKKTYYNNRHY